MKIIFLDIDGVLVTRKSLTNGRSGLRAKADPRAVAQLNRIVKVTGADIVISSTWRYGLGCDRLQTLLRDEWGVKASVIGATPSLNAARSGIVVSPARGDEIQAWIDLMKTTIAWAVVESYVIIDDEADMKHLTPLLVKTEFENGLTKTEADHAINLLMVT